MGRLTLVLVRFILPALIAAGLMLAVAGVALGAGTTKSGTCSSSGSMTFTNSNSNYQNGLTGSYSTATISCP